MSEAGSQEAVTATASQSDNNFEQQVMEQLRTMKLQLEALRAENAELKKKYESPEEAISDENFGDPGGQAEEEQCQTAGGEELVGDWSGQELPMTSEELKPYAATASQVEGKSMSTKVTDRSLREAAETPPGLAHQLLAPAPAMVQQVVGEIARGDATTTAVIHQPQQHVPQAAYLQHGGVQQLPQQGQQHQLQSGGNF